MLEEKRNGTVLKQFQLIGMTKNRGNPLGAKNNDSRICRGASAILKSVDFRAFAVNVKTIAPLKNCINLDTQYGLRTII